MKGKLLSRLLHRNFPLPRMIMASAGLFLGFLLLGLTFQLWLGVKTVFSPEGETSSREYLFFTKKLSGLEGFGIPQPRFTIIDQNALKAQSFVKDWSPIQPNGFRVWAETDITGRNYGTELFLESVPDRLMDVIPKNWTWKPGDPYVPIVVSKDFINLYNFGFSGSRGLPKVTEDSAALVPIILTVWGSKGDKKLPARVVGFSQRINSLLIPKSFMDWANQTVAPEAKTDPERLMVEVSDASDPKIKEFLDKNGWETNTDRLRMSAIVHTAEIVLGFVGVFALVLAGLSLMLVQLTLRLFLTVNQDTFLTLGRIGFAPIRIRVAVFRQSAGPLVAAVLLAMISDFAIASILQGQWSQGGLKLPLYPLTGLGLLVLGALAGTAAWFSIASFFKKSEQL